MALSGEADHRPGEEGPTASGSCLLECAISFSQYIMCTGGSDEGPTLPLAEVEEALRASVGRWRGVWEEGV